jgi:hypothetical protein
MRRKFRMAVAAFLCGILSQAVAAGPDARSAVRVKVSVFNDATIAQTVLNAAKARAEAVFGEAGISLTWLDCGVPGLWHTELGCQDVAFPTHLSVRLVTGSKAVSEDTFGQSYLNERGEGNYANVYLAQLSSSRAAELIGEGDLLGLVVVHELGHLLLGRDSHSSEGLMRARWEAAELREAAKGNLLFTKSEAERMRVRYLSATAFDRVKVSASGK